MWNQLSARLWDQTLPSNVWEALLDPICVGLYSLRLAKAASRLNLRIGWLDMNELDKEVDY